MDSWIDNGNLVITTTVVLDTNQHRLGAGTDEKFGPGFDFNPFIIQD